MQSLSSARQSEIKAWEEEITPCKHTRSLEQCATGSIPAEGIHLHLFLDISLWTVHILQGLHIVLRAN